jgi:hypothetical protein
MDSVMAEATFDEGASVRADAIFHFVEAASVMADAIFDLVEAASVMADATFDIVEAVSIPGSVSRRTSVSLCVIV